MSEFSAARVDLVEELDEKERQIVVDGLGAFNKQAAPLHEVVPLTSVARDGEGRIVGGAIGRTWGLCCELLQLWVDESQRGQGIGTELMRQFEEAARARGCRTFYLDTFTFQAPAFYEKLGYEVAAEFTGFGDGITRYIYVRHESP